VKAEIKKIKKYFYKTHYNYINLIIFVLFFIKYILKRDLNLVPINSLKTLTL